MYFLPPVKWFNVVLSYSLYLLNASSLYLYTSLHVTPAKFLIFILFPQVLEFFFFYFWKLAAIYDATTRRVSCHAQSDAHPQEAFNMCRQQWRRRGVGEMRQRKTTHWQQHPWHRFPSQQFSLSNSLPRRTSLFFKLEHHPTFLKQNAKISFPWDEKRSLKYNVNFYLKAKAAT